MSLNQKILKAINEGIKKSLLSFDDVEFNQSDSGKMNRKVSNDVKDWQFIHENFVDLGLPSGNLWCKANIGANCVVNTRSYAASNTWCGEGFKHGDFSDNLDGGVWYPNPASIKFEKYGGELPTAEDFNELAGGCGVGVVGGCLGVMGLDGAKITGPSGETMFIPLAGFKDAMNIRCYDQRYGYLWTNDPPLQQNKLASVAELTVAGNDHILSVTKCDMKYQIPMRAIIRQ